MNLNYREQLIYQNEKSAKKERDELERQKVDFQAEVDAAAERKIAAEKKRLQKKSECEIAKLRQEEEVIFEAKIEAEKAALQAEYNAEEVKWDRIKAMVPKIAVLTVFFILVIFMFNQCNGIVRDENRALKEQVEAYEHAQYYVCTEDILIPLKDGSSKMCFKGDLVILLDSKPGEYTVLSKKGYEFRINQDMWEDEFIRTSPFFIDEREK